MNGLKWSDVLEDRYDNLDLDEVAPSNGIIQKSDATEACKAIGGELPTRAAFDILEENYGRFQIRGVANKLFWTSSLNGSFGLTYRNGSYASVDRRNQIAIICVEKNP